DLLTPRYWVDLVAQAERGHLDFVTIEDAFTLQNDLPSSAGVAPTG
ncbi:FMNH2-dependent monooxygenase, partial [Mycobacterium rufum]|nr:FMNH2-dependent monooxygenase [Mycolicibacterium rufum]